MIKEKALYLKILSCMVAVVFATALFAADQPAAMLYSHGTAMLNGSSMARSSAIFSGDLVQTNPDSAANINASGSIVLARAAIDAAVKELPHECFPLRNRIMLMSEYPQKNNWRRASVFFVRLERG